MVCWLFLEGCMIFHWNTLTWNKQRNITFTTEALFRMKCLPLSESKELKENRLKNTFSMTLSKKGGPWKETRQRLRRIEIFESLLLVSTTYKFMHKCKLTDSALPCCEYGCSQKTTDKDFRRTSSFSPQVKNDFRRTSSFSLQVMHSGKNLYPRNNYYGFEKVRFHKFWRLIKGHSVIFSPVLQFFWVFSIKKNCVFAFFSAQSRLRLIKIHYYLCDDTDTSLILKILLADRKFLNVTHS